MDRPPPKSMPPTRRDLRVVVKGPLEASRVSETASQFSSTGATDFAPSYMSGELSPYQQAIFNRPPKAAPSSLSGAVQPKRRRPAQAAVVFNRRPTAMSTPDKGRFTVGCRGSCKRGFSRGFSQQRRSEGLSASGLSRSSAERCSAWGSQLGVQGQPRDKWAAKPYGVRESATLDEPWESEDLHSFGGLHSLAEEQSPMGRPPPKSMSPTRRDLRVYHVVGACGGTRRAAQPMQVLHREVTRSL